jgi:hypothetical protein
MQAAWSLLADIASTKVTVDTKAVVEYWNAHSHSLTAQAGVEVWENVLRIIASNVAAISPQQRQKLIGQYL